MTKLQAAPSALEAEFAFQLRAAGLQKRFTRQFQAISGRKYSWDFAAVPERLLIEIQGQIWHKGGHTTGSGITRDAEKLNLAILSNWRQLTFTAEHIKSGQALTWTLIALGIE